MNGLYKRVLKGQYTPINTSYSKALADVVAKMLQVDPDKRPSSRQILELESVFKRATNLGIDYQSELQMPSQYASNLLHSKNTNKEGLLQTIYVPKVLANLGNQLPKANYSV